MDATIIVVGDEILSGHVRDANGHFLSVRLAATGHRLRRTTCVPDDPQEIAAAIRSDLGRLAPGFMFICGGLGPTHDDRTMEGVAQAVGLPLEPCAPIAARVRSVLDRVREAGFAGDPLGAEGLEKMALAPAGSEILPVASGVIPAVTFERGATRFFILPGPPKELEMIVTEAVEPRFLEPSGTPLSRHEVEHPFPESSLASTLTEIEVRFAAVAIGSYPLGDRVLVRIAGPADEAAAAADHLRAAIAAFEASDEGRRLLDYVHNLQRPKS